MRSIAYVGPGIVVLAAAATALLVSPLAVRRASDAQADADIRQARLVLGTDAAPRVVPVAGAAPRTADDDAVALASTDSVLAAINNANRAIARLVEPSVVHVSTLVSMPRQM
ncbi:MAG: hypothetical protein ACKO0W_03625, partial [Planctomycetota bacterium]